MLRPALLSGPGSRPALRMLRGLQRLGVGPAQPTKSPPTGRPLEAMQAHFALFHAPAAVADVRVLRSLAVSGDRLAQGLAIQPLARFAGRAFDPALVALAQSDDIEGSYKHILTDLAAFIFTAIAAVVILTTGFRRADGIAALIVAGIMLWAAYGLLRDSGRVFLEAAPERMDVQEIGRAISKFPNVASYHDLHVWEIGSDFPSLSAHVPVAVGEDCHAIRRGLEQVIEQRFEIDHTTLQVDHERSGQLLSIGSTETLAHAEH